MLEKGISRVSSFLRPPKKTMDTQTRYTCPACGSTNIIAGVAVTKTAEAGSVGLSYRSLAIFRGTAPLYADLCRQCGTVVRLFVRDVNKPWVQG